ncbi:MAG: hypothetical protein AAFY45_33870 [Bacteroidota bacterium]
MANNSEIEKYLDGELSEKQRIAIEVELQRSPELQKQLSLEKATRAVIHLYQTEELKEQFRSYQKTTTNLTKLLTIGSVAAAAIIVLFFLIWNWTERSESVNIENQFSQLSEEESLIRSSSVGTERTKIAHQEQIIAFYNALDSKDSTKLGTTLEEIIAFIALEENQISQPRKKALSFYIGWGYYQLGQYESAYHYLKTAEELSDSRHHVIAKKILSSSFWDNQNIKN